MRRFVNAFILLLVSVATALGGQSAGKQTAEVPSSNFVAATVKSLQMRSAGATRDEFSRSLAGDDSNVGSDRGLAPSPGTLELPTAVFKNGAVFFDFGGNTAHQPMPGGGASGCFDFDLEARSKAVRNFADRLGQPPQHK
jgi:hypothetical protein